MRDVSGVVVKVVTFLPLAVVLLGTGLLGYGGHVLYKSWQSTSWPSYDGVITGAKTEETSATGLNRRYSSSITYDYEVKGQRFSGSKLGMAKEWYVSVASAECDMKRYPIGRRVKVFVSPADTADCVLEPGIQASSWFIPLLGSAFVVVVALMFSISFAASVYRKTRRVVEKNPFVD